MTHIRSRSCDFQCDKQTFCLQMWISILMIWSKHHLSLLHLFSRRVSTLFFFFNLFLFQFRDKRETLRRCQCDRILMEENWRIGNCFKQRLRTKSFDFSSCYRIYNSREYQTEHCRTYQLASWLMHNESQVNSCVITRTTIKSDFPFIRKSRRDLSNYRYVCRISGVSISHVQLPRDQLSRFPQTL